MHVNLSGSYSRLNCFSKYPNLPIISRIPAALMERSEFISITTKFLLKDQNR